jgi:hypothetical protein
MFGIENIISEYDTEEEKLEAIFQDYIVFRKSFLIEDIEMGMIFLIGNIISREDYGYDNWSSLHFFLEQKYKEKDFSRCKLVKDSFVSKLGSIDDALEFVNSAMYNISLYRQEAASFFDNDIIYLSSYFDIYATGDYLRFSFLEDILLKEFLDE